MFLQLQQDYRPNIGFKEKVEPFTFTLFEYPQVFPLKELLCRSRTLASLGLTLGQAIIFLNK